MVQAQLRFWPGFFGLLKGLLVFLKSRRMLVLAGLASVSVALVVTQVSAPALAASSSTIWAPLSTLRGSNADALQTALVALPGGGATAVWGDESELKAATRESSGLWSPPTTIATVNESLAANFPATMPSVAVAPSGEVMVAWLDREDWGSSSTTIFEATQEPGASNWSAPQPVSVLGYNDGYPQLSFGTNGLAALAWQDDAGIEVSTRAVDASGWSAPVVVSDVTDASTYPSAQMPRVAVDTSGDIVVTWFGPAGGDAYRLRGSAWTASTGQWSSPTWISAGDVFDQNLLTSSVDGTVTAAWDGSADDAATWSDGSWGTPIQVLPNGLSSLSPGPGGETIATGVDDSRHVIFSVHNATGWSAPSVVNSGDSAPSYGPQVTSAADGSLTVMWMSVDGTGFQLRDATRHVGTTSWSQSEPVAPGTVDAEGFSVVESPFGALDVIIEDQVSRRTGRDGGWALEADSTVLPHMTALSAPTVAGTPAVGQTLHAKSGTWSATPQSVGYQWRRNGVAIPAATRATYAPALADVGRRLSVTVTVARVGYRSSTVTITSVAIPRPRMRDVIAPTIRGRWHVGHLLLASAGRWSPTPTRVTYQWLRDGHAISGARHAAYRVKPTDLHHRLRVRVTATRTGYLGGTGKSTSMPISR